MRYTTYGSVRGMGPIRETEREAERDLEIDRRSCHRQGGDSDRHVCYVGDDGYLYYLYHDTDCNSWVIGPGGRSCGGVRV